MSKYTLHKISANDAFTTNLSHLKELAPEFARVSQGLGDSKSNAGAVGIFGGPERILPVLHGASSDGNYKTTYGHSEREGMIGALKKLINEYGKESPFPNYHNQHSNPLENAQSYTQHADSYQKPLEEKGHIVNIWSEWPPCANQQNKPGGACASVLNNMLPKESYVAHIGGPNYRAGLIKTWNEHKQQKPQQMPTFLPQPQSSTQYSGGFRGFAQPSVQHGFTFQQPSSTGYSSGFGQSSAQSTLNQFNPSQNFRFNQPNSNFTTQQKTKPRETSSITGLELQQIHDQQQIEDESELYYDGSYLGYDPEYDPPYGFHAEYKISEPKPISSKKEEPSKKEALEQEIEQLRSDLNSFNSAEDYLTRNHILSLIQLKERELKKYAHGGSVKSNEHNTSLTPEEARIAEIFNMSPAEYKKLQTARFKNKDNQAQFSWSSRVCPSKCVNSIIGT